MSFLVTEAVAVWTAKDRGQRVWECPLPAAGGRPNCQTLADIAAPLRRVRQGRLHRELLDPSDSRLADLDLVVRELAAAVVGLHARRRTVGLLTPLNVLLVSDAKGNRRVVLPDAGFEYDGTGTTPDWAVKPDTLRERVAARKLTFELGEERDELAFREQWYPNPLAAHAGYHPADDLVSVARVMDWVLSGVARTEPPGPGDPDTHGLRVYPLLDAVCRHEVATAAELARRLSTGKSGQSTLVSEAFLKPAPPVSVSRPAGGRLMIAGLVAVGIGGAAVFFAALPDRPVVETRNADFPMLPTDSSAAEHADALSKLLAARPADPEDAADKWLPALVAELGRAAEALAAKPHPQPAQAAAERAAQRVMVERVRLAFDDVLDERSGGESFARLMAERNKPPAAAADLMDRVLTQYRTLKDKLTPLETPSWTPRWLDAIVSMSRQYRQAAGR